MNAFQPATELGDPFRFAGREKQVRQLADSLHAIGSVPMIYGDRGLGKSSLALQLSLIALGDVELLSEMGAERLALEPNDLYITFFVTCTDSTQNVDGLIQLLLNAAESVDNTAASGASHLVDKKTRKKLSFKMFEHETTRTYATAVNRLSYQDLGIGEKLVQVCDIIAATYGQRVLFIVDELDRLGDPAGLASYLKAVSSETLKFVLVGIASNVADLLSDHQSLERRLSPVKVPTMEPRELREIITKAEQFLDTRDYVVKFDDDAVLALVKASSGYPWFVHVLGQQCLLDADDDGRTVIEEQHVQAAIDSIVQNRFAQQFSDQYQMAVKDSWQRELTLRAFAQWGESDIPVSEVYRLLRRAGVSGASTYKGQLCSEDYGGILIPPAFQKRGLARFKNDMFKVYVRMRRSIYEDVDIQARRLMSS